MSTLQLTPEHLSAIVYGLKAEGIIDPRTRNENVINWLLDQNLRSCGGYSLDLACIDDFEGFYEYKQPEAQLTALDLYKLTQCYQYNSEGSPNWETSTVKRWTDELMDKAPAFTPDEYNAAKWSI